MTVQAEVPAPFILGGLCVADFFQHTNVRPQGAEKRWLNVVGQAVIGQRSPYDGRNFFVVHMTNSGKQMVLYLVVKATDEPR